MLVAVRFCGELLVCGVEQRENSQIKIMLLKIFSPVLSLENNTQ